MDTPRDVVFTIHEARRGVAWLKDAWALFSRARAPWLFMLGAYYLVMMAVDLVPLVGQLAVPLIKPAFAVGFLAAAWTQERGGTPRVRDLFMGFHSYRRRWRGTGGGEEEVVAAEELYKHIVERAPDVRSSNEIDRTPAHPRLDLNSQRGIDTLTLGRPALRHSAGTVGG